MAEATFIVDGNPDVRVTVNDSGGNLNFTLEVLETGPSNTIGDLRAFYFDVNGPLNSPAITNGGTEVTDSGFNTQDLGNDTNMNPAPAFDVGVEFGTQGIGSDDIRTASFTLDASNSLSVSMLVGQRFGTRLTSVGPEDGDRNPSSKNVDVPDVCPCTDHKVDFKSFEAGDTINFVKAGAVGIKIKAIEKGEGNPDNDAMAFDADQAPPVSGGDDDLLAGDGTVLIISEDDDSSDPDDADNGGKFVFNFTKKIDLTSLDVIDTEEGGWIKAYGAGGSFLGKVNVPILPDNGIDTVDLSQFDDVKRLVVKVNGSAALDDLCFTYCQCDDLV